MKFIRLLIIIVLFTFSINTFSQLAVLKGIGYLVFSINDSVNTFKYHDLRSDHVSRTYGISDEDWRKATLVNAYFPKTYTDIRIGSNKHLLKPGMNTIEFYHPASNKMYKLKFNVKENVKYSIEKDNNSTLQLIGDGINIDDAQITNISFNKDKMMDEIIYYSPKSDKNGTLIYDGGEKMGMSQKLYVYVTRIDSLYGFYDFFKIPIYSSNLRNKLKFEISIEEGNHTFYFNYFYLGGAGKYWRNEDFKVEQYIEKNKIYKVVYEKDKDRRWLNDIRIIEVN